MRTPLFVTIALVGASALMTGCSIDDPPAIELSLPTTQVTPEEVPTYPAPVKTPDVRLTATVLAGNASEQWTRHLACVGTLAVEGTDFANGDNACQLLAATPDLLDRDLKESDDTCRGTGNPTIADVFGEAYGIQIRNSFRLDNECNTETWDKLSPLLGQPSDKL